MSHSDVSLGEIETLRRLRRHRADRAERALREATRARQALVVNIQEAQETLEQTRLDEARKSAELFSQHQGQVLSLQALKSWGKQELSLSESTRHDEGQLQKLQGQREEKDIHVGRAQLYATQCLRQVEKLQELSNLLIQEQI